MVEKHVAKAAELPAGLRDDARCGVESAGSSGGGIATKEIVGTREDTQWGDLMDEEAIHFAGVHVEVSVAWPRTLHEDPLAVAGRLIAEHEAAARANGAKAESKGRGGRVGEGGCGGRGPRWAEAGASWLARRDGWM
ncbi:unnamed protein product [Prorocentrum cordatum]|uniref:Uncharacterized protein n=1 Tax=Prorocentrum cordatum TaxID=2364126 RepID=A0ABN9WRN8_9DINO|nr:unnamed protein product [Polarella glacialis]